MQEGKKWVGQAYGVQSNAFVQKSAPDPVNGNLVEIGDSKQPQAFFPQVKLTRWGNECNFSMRLVEWDNSDPTITTDGNVVKYTKPSYEARWFDLGFDDDTGGHEHLVILNQAPPANQIQWTLRTKGLVFYPQPALTPEEIAEGCFRPDDIVDSIAVYHASKRNNFAGGKNYKSGKAFHLKRIVLTDAKGQTAYGTQDIQITNPAGDGVYTVTLPQEFLDSAVYPVMVDPTIGYTTHGGSGVGWGPVAIASMVSQYTASSGDSITGYTFYGLNSVGGANNVQMAAYTVVSSQPSARLAAAVAFTVGTSTAEYTSATVSQSLTAGATYCVAMTATGASGTTTLAFDNGSTPGRFNSANAGLLDPFGVSGTDSGRHYSWWATVEAGGGGDTYTISPDQGSYSLTGEAVSLAARRQLAISNGSYALSGQSVALTVGRVVAIGQGSYAVTGEPITLTAARKLALTYGAYVLTGEDVTLTYTPGGTTYTLTVGQGAYSLSGQDVTFIAGRQVTLSYATYSLSGQAVGLHVGKSLSAAQGAYSLTGEALAFTYSRALKLSHGSYAVAGQAVSLNYSGAQPSVWTPVTPATGEWSASSPGSAEWTGAPSQSTVWS